MLALHVPKQTHADKPQVIDTTAEKYEFSGVSGPNGDDGDGSVCTTTASDADPDNGTSDYAESVAEMDSSSKRQLATGRFHSRRTGSQ